MNSPELLAFIRASIRSVWAMELLLVLKRQDRAWTAKALVQEMRASEAVVAEVLATFEATGLVRREGDDGYIYAPAAPALEQLCDKLERLYRERPASVVRTILSSPNDKLQSFADAFRFKEPPK